MMKSYNMCSHSCFRIPLSYFYPPIYNHSFSFVSERTNCFVPQFQWTAFDFISNDSYESKGRQGAASVVSSFWHRTDGWTQRWRMPEVFSSAVVINTCIYKALCLLLIFFYYFIFWQGNAMWQLNFIHWNFSLTTFKYSNCMKYSFSPKYCIDFFF